MPLPNIPVRDLEILMDALAYMLSTDTRTSNIVWVLGDVGMGVPAATPFGYISVLSETVVWYTAQGGGSGGLAAGGSSGLDDWLTPIVLTVAHEPHRYIQPVTATPDAINPANPFAPANLGSQVVYLEQPGWRQSQQFTQQVKRVLRTNATIGGAATTTRIVESRFVLVQIQDQMFRCTRMTIQAQQRRTRGN